MVHLTRRFSGYVFLYVAIASIVIQVVIFLMLNMIRFLGDNVLTIVNLISLLIVFLPPLIMIAVRKYPISQTLRIKTFSLKYVWYSIGIGICLFLCIHFLTSLISNLISTTVYQMEPAYFGSTYHSLWPYVLTSCLIPVFLETMFFQGAVQSGLYSVKPLKACVIVGILFGLLVGGANAIVGSSAFAILCLAIYGFALSYISLQAGSIIPSMIAGFSYYLFSYADLEDMLYQYCLSPLGISEIAAAVGLLILGAVTGGLLLFKLPKTQDEAKPLSMPSLSDKKIRDRLTQPWIPAPLDKETQAAEEPPSVDMTTAPVAETPVFPQEPIGTGEEPLKGKNRGFIIGVVLLTVLTLAASGYKIYAMVTISSNN